MSITIEKAAAWFEDRAKNTPMPGAREMFEIAAAALREKAEREHPKPLTFEELRQTVGEPVWLHTITDPRPHRCGLLLVEVAEIRIARYCAFWAFGNECEIDRNPDEYGKTWICYRHKPKEVQE